MAIVVKREPGESEDRLISKFRKKIQAEQILTVIKEREHYKKPSVIKKEKLACFRKKKRKKTKKQSASFRSRLN